MTKHEPVKIERGLQSVLESIETKRAAGIKPPTLAPPPRCETCRDLGYIYPDPTDRMTVAVCPVCAGGQQIDVKATHHLSKILTAQYSQTFDNFHIYGPHAGHLRTIKAAAMAFAEKPEGWLILRGDTGNGKSHLMAAVYNALAHRIGGNKVIFTPMAELLAKLQELFDRHDDEERVESRVAKFRDVAVLLLDDIGAEFTSPWVDAMKLRVLDHRYGMGLPTMVCSNLDEGGIARRLGSRMSDAAFCKIFNNPADDFRRLPVALREQIAQRAGKVTP